jgi:hypothetical protein
MKTAVKIIAYCVWFGFTLWLSFWFLRLAAWIENRNEIFFGNTRFWTLSIFWFGFVLLLAWLPVWLAKKRFPDFARLMAKIGVFLVVLLACIILSEIIWDNFFAGTIYNCTDDNLGGFLRPGDWVHNPVTVSQVKLDSDMSHPDIIKQGWSISKLWILWWSFAVACLVVSALSASLIWRKKPAV